MTIWRVQKKTNKKSNRNKGEIFFFYLHFTVVDIDHLSWVSEWDSKWNYYNSTSVGHLYLLDLICFNVFFPHAAFAHTWIREMKWAFYISQLSRILKFILPKYYYSYFLFLCWICSRSLQFHVSNTHRFFDCKQYFYVYGERACVRRLFYLHLKLQSAEMDPPI